MFTHPDYTVLRTLGQGGSATVLLAVQKSLNRPVALKVLHSAALMHEGAASRFLREARTVAKLSHRHIVPVYAVGPEPDGPGYYMAMEYLRCGTLLQLRRKLNQKALLCTLQQVASALAFSHAKGFVHRDVKSDNILFRKPGEAVLTDFGIARLTESLTRLTATGAVLGTPAYMSPEQVQGLAVDARSDLYSLGIVLYEMLAGVRPFSGDSMISTGLMHLTQPVPPLPVAASAYQPMIDLLLAKSADDRLQSATELLLQLHRLEERVADDLDKPLCALHHDLAYDRPDVSSPQVQSDRPRRLWRLPAALSSLLVAGAMVYWFALQPSPDLPLQPTSNATRPAPDTPTQTVPEAPAESTPSQPTTSSRAAPSVEQEETARQAAEREAARQAAEQEAAEQEAARQVAEREAARQAAEREAARQAAEREAAEQEAARQAARQVAERRRRIDRLLADAGEVVDQPQTSVQAASAAFAGLAQVLRLDPGNATALSGRETLVQRLVELADRAVQNGDFAAADAALALARRELPEHETIAPLVARLADARERTEAAQLAAEAEAAHPATEAAAEEADHFLLPGF